MADEESEQSGYRVHKVVKKQTGKFPPLIVNFNHATNVKPGSFENELRPSMDINDDKINLAFKGGHLKYSTNATSVKNLKSNPYTKTWLAVRNKKTGKVRLIESEIKNVGPEVTPPETANHILVTYGDAPEPSDPKEAAKLRAIMNRHLIKSFGQEKGKRFYDQQDRMRVETEELSDKLSKVAENVDESSLILENTEREKIDLIPVRNETASDPRNVYDVNDLLTEAELSALEEAAEGLTAEYPDVETIAKGIKSKALSPLLGFILNRQRKEVRKIALAIYAESLATFMRLRPSDLKKGPLKSLPIFVPTSLKYKTFEHFMVNGGVTPASRDKTACYLIITLLMANNYAFDSSILKATRIKQDQLKKLVQVVGATMMTDSVTEASTIALKIPLTSFDVNKVYKKKKGAKF